LIDDEGRKEVNGEKTERERDKRKKVYV